VAVLKDAAQITSDDSREQARSRLAELVTKALGPGDEANQTTWHLALLSGLDWPDDHGTSAPSPAPDQRLLHASVRRFVEAFSSQMPVCLIVDDIQWADDSLLDLLESLAGRIREASFLLLTMARPELTASRPAWGGSVRSSTVITLEALSQDLERALIEALIRERGLSSEIAERIGRSAGGNPLFAEEIVAMIAEGGPAAGVPSVIKMLIAARLDALPPDERHTLQLAAVLGKTIWPGGLTALGAGSQTTVAVALDNLEQKDLVRPLPRSQLRGERECSFKHDLIRDVAYETLPRAERRQLHALAATWLEAAAGDQVEVILDQLAHHAVEAGQRERAIGFLQRAAARASRAAAQQQAAALLGQAIDLARELQQPMTVVELQAQRGLALASVGLWEAARPDLEAALAGLPSDRLAERAQLLLKLYSTSLWLLDLDGMQRYAQAAVTAANESARRDLAAAGMICLSQAASLEGQLDDSVKLFERAVAYAGDAGVAGSAGNTIQALNLYWLGRYGEAVPAAQQMLEWSRGDTTIMLESLPALGMAYAGQGRYAEAEQVFAEARRFGREFEIWPQLARAIAMSAGWRLSVGDFEGHAAVAEEARELARSVKFTPPTVSAGIDLVLNYARRGEPDRADPLWPEIEAAVERAGAWHRWLWKLRGSQARAEQALARADWEEAMRWAEASLAASRAHGRAKYVALALEVRGKVHLARGRKHDALNDVRQALGMAQTSGDPAMLLRMARTLGAAEPDAVAAQVALSAAGQIAVGLPQDDTRQRLERSGLSLPVIQA
jgi:tetratricopeptide (TPR) repeat protein